MAWKNADKLEEFQIYLETGENALKWQKLILKL